MSLFRDDCGCSLSSGVSLTVHPPERRRRRSVVVASGCCCSCCCSCCLHSLGGLIGAMRCSHPEDASSGRSVSRGSVANAVAGEASPGSDEMGFRVARILGVRIYWLSTLVVAVLVLLFAPIISGGGGDDVILGAVVLVVAMPAVQLAAAIVAVVVAFAVPNNFRVATLNQIGLMTLGVIVGAIVGLLPMLFLLPML